MIAGDIAGMIFEHLAGLVRKHVPDRRRASVLSGCAFDLVSGRSDAPGEIFWEWHGETLA